ncbi:MAG: phosphoenolpyruvate--protein phosphotransferase [Lachnospiraceae bacterium]|nr:phosphoenolpyruvate--protein phosphotransferase [Lachnospiraceae bacterium]
MKILNGEIISSGIIMGAIYFNSKATTDIEKLIENRNKEISSDDLQSELDIYKEATIHVKNHYLSLCKKTEQNGGVNKDDEIVAIFEGLSLIVVDEELTEAITNDIKEKFHTAEYAVYMVSRNFMATLEVLEDGYIRQRAKDIEEVANKLISEIVDRKKNNYNDNIKDNLSLNNKLPHILIVDKVLSEMLISNGRDEMMGIVAKECGENSHAAIIARTLEIPVLLVDSISDMEEGEYGILDSEKGELIINPTDEIKESYIKLINTIKEDRDELKKYKDIKVKCVDGREINIFANVSCIKDIEAAIENGTEGIGLFRSELLYMDREIAPTEEEQFLVYKEAAKLLGDKPLTIRTFDAGMDKELKFIKSSGERSLAIDSRGISLLLQNVDIFKTQLRAIYRAAVYGNIKVMFPMISYIDEVYRIKEILSEIKKELETDNQPFKDIEVGIMIETPSAVTFSDVLTSEVDFVSIGTNDLIQYTFAYDRDTQGFVNLTDKEYEELFKMIGVVVNNAHKNGCKVSVCGELAGEIRFANKFIETGIDQLSVASSKILILRKQIISLL